MKCNPNWLRVALDRFGIRVDQQLVRIAALLRGRIVREAHPAAVALTRIDTGKKPCHTKLPTSGSLIRVSVPSSSNRHSSTHSATSLNTAKLVPQPS